ncbi:arogenate dehydrogenase 2, chloroplastic [Sesamum indicum]|uniref:Arogenate dehydrogenase 2, chloroplastic n=1 Tax=Sesamum indicum TaxID=4182 RepID=A0A6I9TS44_SESIN|nr:arogenate dehydrogenase 2, chloroplastic [Sesamum indicum]XP_011084076.1 arogenate dehydrogenase 2, chloroplastic [Sesamum indicum]XP_011084077.1 arogenate dehydrogenase 2, chloroplastic [Sesamum indicum]
MISFSSTHPTSAAQPPTTSASASASSAAGTSRLFDHHVSKLSSLSLPQFHQYSGRYRRGLRVRAIDAAQPYDCEAHLMNRFTQSTKLKIAIIGFGNFGQFLAKAFIRRGHTVYAHSRSNYLSVAQSMGAAFFSDLHDLCEQHPDVILICTSIISTESVLKSLPLQRLRRNTLFVDVLSVKEFPKNIFLQVLPPYFDILCTHPMFGPESGKHSWQNLPFVFEKVRIGNEESRLSRVENFLDIFKKEGCRMVEMTCAEHDKYAAGTQFITHTMGRILEKLQLDSTPINTKGYETLLDLVDNTASDSFDLYYGLFMYNKNAMEQLERLDLAFEALKKELFGHLHEILRKQLFGKAEEGGLRGPLLGKLPKNGAPLLPPGTPQVENVGEDGN